MAQTATAQVAPTHEYAGAPCDISDISDISDKSLLRALERAVRAHVEVIARGTLADGTPFVTTSSASRPGATHTVRAYLGGRITCDSASRADRMCTHRALAQAEWAADEAERSGDEVGWRPTPKGRALAIFDDQRARWANEEAWMAFWATLFGTREQAHRCQTGWRLVCQCPNGFGSSEYRCGTGSQTGSNRPRSVVYADSLVRPPR